MAHPQLKKLLKSPSFTAAGAAKFGISSSLLAYYIKLGMIERVARGVYRNPNLEKSAPFEWQDLLEIAQSVPSGTICLISALAYYGLTQEIQRQYWMAVQHPSKGVKRPNTKIVRMRNTTLGRIKLKIGEYNIHIFDRERCVVDAFRYLSKETALYSLKEYLKRTEKHKPDLSKLTRYAKNLRTNIVPYIEALA